VFIEEQNIPEYIEIDVNEEKANYILAYVEGQPVGTARWRETKLGIKLERFAVLPQFRSYGIGKKLTRFILNKMNSQKSIYLNAQESVIPFYKKCGFQTVGPKFDEANGISHQKMIYLESE
jgi:predicted GNAT family N-acyltransferase